MTTVTASQVQELRQRTGVGMMECKRALEEAQGDIDRAVDILRLKGQAKAAKKAGRVANEGRVEAYIHLGGKIGVLIELDCETDFVAKTDDYRDLARTLAMQVAATSPLAVRREEIDPEVVEREAAIYRQQAEESGKPAEIVEKIARGRLDKWYQEVCLLEQAFVKDPDRKVSDVVTEAVQRLGENIVVRRFVRFEVGGE
ncbi:MAG TPA: translation elongation factor Ts [Gemmatimonadota bacterium]|jgi:elongation factor Ts|nr:translation elongation factor Ts [Gemmatimonadota bacterium]